MNFKRILRKAVTLLCCSAVLALSVLPVPVSAADVYDYDFTEVDIPKIFDIIMTQHGVVANSEIIEEVYADYKREVVETIDQLKAVYDWDGTEACDRDTFEANLDATEGIGTFEKQLYLDAYDKYCTDGTYSWLNNWESICNSDLEPGLQKYLVGDGIAKGSTYTIDAALSEDVMNCFDDYWSAQRGYYLVRTRKFSDYAQPTNFTYAADYYSFCSFIDTADDNIYAMQFSPGSAYTSIYKFFNDAFLCTNSSVTSAGVLVLPSVQGLNADWSTSKGRGLTVYMPYGNSDKTYTYDNVVLSELDDSNCTASPKIQCNTDSFQAIVFVAKTNRNVKVWKNLDDFKGYSVGKQSVYYTSTYNSSVYSPVTYTGDYYCDTSSYYNYSTVQNAIDNSVDSSTTLTDSIVDSVVDNSVTNIVNNYYYTDPGTGGSSGSGGSSDSDGSDSSNPFNGIFEKLSEVLGNVVGVLDDIVALILSFIADALNGIVSIFTSVINMLTEFKDEVSGLSGALSEFFPYVPEEFWTIIMTTISVICGLAIIKYFTSK